MRGGLQDDHFRPDRRPTKRPVATRMRRATASVVDDPVISPAGPYQPLDRPKPLDRRVQARPRTATMTLRVKFCPLRALASYTRVGLCVILVK